MSTLSLRLKTIASLVPPGARVCDVGTDHARLPIYLKQNNIAKTVIATDLNEKPLKNAQTNIEQSGVRGISLRLCDGLSAVTADEADTVIIAGIGGEVISGILKNCDWIKNKGVSLILQPTTSPEVLRRFLTQNGFEIVIETPVFENKKIYSVITAKYTANKAVYPDSYYYIGEIPKTDDGIVYIKKQQRRIFECMTALENIESRKDEYEFYNRVFGQIENLLTEKTNGI